MRAWGFKAFGLAWCRRAGALLRCLDLGMVPRGPLVAGRIWGARAPLYSMVRGCHEAWQGAGVTGQSRFKWIQLGSSTAQPQETRSRVAFSGERGQNFYLPAISAHFRPLPLIFSHCGHFQPLPPIFAIWCPDRLAVSGDLKIGTAFNTAFRLEIRHEAWQEPSVIKTRLPWQVSSIRVPNQVVEHVSILLPDGAGFPPVQECWQGDGQTD